MVWSDFGAVFGKKFHGFLILGNFFFIFLNADVKLSYSSIAAFNFFGNIFVPFSLGYHIFLNPFFVINISFGNFIQLLLFLD